MWTSLFIILDMIGIGKADFFLRKYIFNPLFTALCKLLGFWFLLKWLNQGGGHTVGWRPNQKKKQRLTFIQHVSVSVISTQFSDVKPGSSLDQAQAPSTQLGHAASHVSCDCMHFTPRLSMMSVLSNGNNMTPRFDNRYKNHTSILHPRAFLHLGIYCVF